MIQDNLLINSTQLKILTCFYLFDDRWESKIQKPSDRGLLIICEDNSNKSSKGGTKNGLSIISQTKCQVFLSVGILYYQVIKYLFLLNIS